MSSSEVTKLRIAVVDDHPIFLEGLLAVFRGHEAFEVVAQGYTGEDACSIATTLQPDIMLLDKNLPGGGPRLISQVLGAAPACRVVVLSVSSDKADIVTAFEAGAAGYLVKGINGRDLRHSILAIQNQQTYILPEVGLLTALQSARRSIDTRQRELDVTPQEFAVLKKLADGMSNQAVAIELSISEKTVKNHVTAILSKLGVRNRIEAINVFRDRYLSGSSPSIATSQPRSRS